MMAGRASAAFKEYEVCCLQTVRRSKSAESTSMAELSIRSSWDELGLSYQPPPMPVTGRDGNLHNPSCGPIRRETRASTLSGL